MHQMLNQGQNSDMGEGGIKNVQNNSDVFYGPNRGGVAGETGKTSVLP